MITNTCGRRNWKGMWMSNTFSLPLAQTTMTGSVYLTISLTGGIENKGRSCIQPVYLFWVLWLDLFFFWGGGSKRHIYFQVKDDIFNTDHVPEWQGKNWLKVCTFSWAILLRSSPVQSAQKQVPFKITLSKFWEDLVFVEISALLPGPRLPRHPLLLPLHPPQLLHAQHPAQVGIDQKMFLAPAWARILMLFFVRERIMLSDSPLNSTILQVSIK